MKQNIRFNLKQQSLIIEALESYQRRLKGMNLRRFNSILEKVKNNEQEFDSEELIYIVQALRVYSKLMYLTRQSLVSAEYRKLANKVEKIRILFQKKNNPLKRYLKKLWLEGVER